MPVKRTRRFDETIIEILKTTTNSDMRLIATILTTTHIHKKYRKRIFKAWQKRRTEMNCPDYNVTPVLGDTDQLPLL